MPTLYVAPGYASPGYVNGGIWIDWATRVIFVPKAETVQVQSAPTEIRELDLDAFRRALKTQEDDPAGMAYVDTHRHVAPISVGGVQLARVVEIINGYVVEFEDGQYAVNLVGANSNVGDRVVVNQVSVRSANSAGLTDLEAAPSANQVAAQVRAELAAELTRILELATIHGLVQGQPLTVAPTQRQAGEVVQNITEAGGVVTVARSA